MLRACVSYYELMLGRTDVFRALDESQHFGLSLLYMSYIFHWELCCCVRARERQVMNGTLKALTKHKRTATPNNSCT